VSLRSFSPGGLEVLAAFAPVVAVAVEPLVGLLDDPQPAVSVSVQQAIAAVRPVFIGSRSFPDKFV
jgi:hypothetical protein